MRRDLKGRLKGIKKRVSQKIGGNSALTDAISHMNISALERSLSRYQELSLEELERIHRLALLMQQNPTGEVPEEFCDLKERALTTHLEKVNGKLY